MADILLLPQPRELEIGDSYTSLQQPGWIVINNSALLFEAQWLQKAASEHGLHWQIVTSAPELGLTIELLLDSDSAPQAYELLVRDERIIIRGSHSGVFYGVCTLAQLLTYDRYALPHLRIDDWPDLSARGVLLDISRDKVPTMTTLYDLVDLLASLKVNQLQLYTEHTFAYLAHEIVWRHASPMTAQEILELDAYCKQRHIELVPNQNSLGHMERWLKHAPYINFAEMPHGFVNGWGEPMEPTTVDPSDPRSLALFEGLYAELLPNFSSSMFNVGCDEPWELGLGKSKAAVEAGGGRVYLGWLQQLHGLVRSHQRQMMIWGDIIVKYPALVPELPEDVIVLEWGYEATHPFEERAQLYKRSDKAFYVCPGTSSWNSLIGRTKNALDNIREAARAGIAHGASGFLNTDWGDAGHWQSLPISYAGFAYGAGVSWGYSANIGINLSAALDRFVFRDAAGVMGQLAYDLGNIYRRIGPEHINGQILFYILQTEQRNMDAKMRRIVEWGGAQPDLSQEMLRNVIAQIDAITYAARQQKMQRDDSALIVREFEQAARLAKHGAKWLMLLHKYPDFRVDELQSELRSIEDEQRSVWLARNRRGGLEDSMQRFGVLRGEYERLKH